MSNRPKLILSSGARIRPNRRPLINKVTGRVFPCCYPPCEDDADRQFQLRRPHENPRPGQDQEWAIYTFCSREHLELYAIESQRGRPGAALGLG